jgi:hypothetical protein
VREIAKHEFYASDPTHPTLSPTGESESIAAARCEID